MSISTYRPKVPRDAQLIMAAMIQAGDQDMDTDTLERIVAQYDTNVMMDATWKLVLSGEVGVSWDEQAGEARFYYLPPEEARRRGRILADIKADKMGPPWPEPEAS
jgi:hypothetical protein